MRILPFSLILCLLLWCISHCLFFLPDGSIATDFPGVWGDWSLHAAHSWWFAEQPFTRWLDPRILRFDESFAYPPLINFISGMLLRSGLGFQPSMIIPCIFFAGIFGVFLNLLFRRAGASPWSASVLSAAFVLAGGTRTIAAMVIWSVHGAGFGVDVDGDAHHAANFMDHLFQAASEGINSGSLSQVWLTPLFSMILPQRTFLAGIAVGCASLLVVLQTDRRSLRFSLPVASGRLLVLLPLLALAHVYSWLVLILVVVVVALSDVLRSRPAPINAFRHWLIFAGPGIIASLLVIWIIMPGIGSKTSGMDWSPGWMASETGQGIFLFWIVNWSVFLPLVLIAASVSREFRRDPCFLSGALIFVAMNVIKLQPWSWDNSKFLVWALLLLALPLVRFFSQIKFRTMAVVALLMMCIDGITSIAGSLVAPKPPLVLWTSGEQVIAAWARKTLPLDAIILSPSHQDHKYWAFALTGRRNVQAYGGWIWTHGFSAEPLQSRATLMLEHPTASLEAMRGLGITHVAVPENGGSIQIGFLELKKTFKPVISFENQSVFAVP